MNEIKPETLTNKQSSNVSNSKSMPKISFNNRPNPFSVALKQKVDAYFKKEEVNPVGNSPLFFKNIFLIASLVVLYVILVFFTPVAWVSTILCGLLGLNFALIGFNVMHEGGHQSLSKHKWLNIISGYSLNVMGGNIYFWKLKHNISHHTYTNIDGEDHDINLKPFMRMDENQPRYWFHKYQYLYWAVFYCMAYFAWISFEDFNKYFTGRMGPKAEKHKLSVKEHFIFWITKILYAFAYIVLPMFLVGVVKTIIGYSIAAIVCGFVISVVFQMAHTVEVADFPQPDEASNKIESEWAIHQINTTANFATKNKVISWFVGGLNFQVEHHLFPKVSHVYYSKIRPLVIETCQEFNITYNEYPSFFKAFASHLRHLKKLGTA